MNFLLKVAAGLVGGIAIVGSLCFSERKQQKPKNVGDDIPDSILDGPLPTQLNPEEPQQTKAEENIRNIQTGLNKASNVIEQISSIVRSIIRIFFTNDRENYYYNGYECNNQQKYPTTMIF